MRIRVTESELQYYAKAKRDNTPVRVQGYSWQVIGITADHVVGEQQYWVELVEAR
jgi:hypothetical protein